MNEIFLIKNREQSIDMLRGLSIILIPIILEEFFQAESYFPSSIKPRSVAILYVRAILRKEDMPHLWESPVRCPLNDQYLSLIECDVKEFYHIVLQEMNNQLAA